MQLFINGAGCFRLDFPSGFRIYPHGQTGENEFPVIVQPCHGSHRGAGRPDGVALMQSNGRKNVLHGVHVRLVHTVHELAHVRGKGFHITPLPFCIQRVHGQTRFPRSGRSRHHRQPPQGNVHIHILQIMLTGAADADAPILTMTHRMIISSIWNHSKRSTCHEPWATTRFHNKTGQKKVYVYTLSQLIVCLFPCMTQPECNGMQPPVSCPVLKRRLTCSCTGILQLMQAKFPPPDRNGSLPEPEVSWPEDRLPESPWKAAARATFFRGACSMDKTGHDRSHQSG